MNLAEAFTSDLLAELARRRALLAGAELASPNPRTRELAAGVGAIELELKRRARYLPADHPVRAAVTV